MGEDAFLADFANDVDPVRARVLYAVQGRIAATLFSGRTNVAAWRVLRCWYAVSWLDRTTNPDLERFLTQRMQAASFEVESGHLSMITHPEVIANLILEAAGAS